MKNLTKTYRNTSIFLLIFTGINAIIAGFLFIIAPSGNKMGMTTEYLKNSPFSSYLIPGIILFLVNGVLNLISAFMTIKKHQLYPLLIILQGILLTGWIFVQVLMVRDFNILHFVMGSIGITLIICGFNLKKI